jgi:hypothetical protein
MPSDVVSGKKESVRECGSADWRDLRDVILSSLIVSVLSPRGLPKDEAQFTKIVRQ